MTVLTVWERRDTGPPLHRHSRQDETIVILEGRATFFVAGEHIDGPEGTCVVLPQGIEHGYVVTSDSARLLVVLAPAEPGLEACVVEMSRYTDAVAAGLELETELAVERLVATAAQFGIEVTGPPPGSSAI